MRWPHRAPMCHMSQRDKTGIPDFNNNMSAEIFQTIIGAVSRFSAYRSGGYAQTHRRRAPWSVKNR